MKYTTKFKFSKLLPITTLTIALLANTNSAFASDDFFVRTFVGLSSMSDLTANATDIDGSTGAADVSLDSGFNAGLGFGYFYNPNFAVELAWEYRTNDSSVELDDGNSFQDGNYASNLIMLNGYYFFDKINKWTPYLGAGIVWGQEIDIDLERNGTERSFSEGGDFGYQAFAGVNYELSREWVIHGELRYTAISSIDLSAEESELQPSSGSVTSIDYKPLTLQVGLEYRF
jgi:outer membrane protein W